jgi:hypothetical protein
MIGHNRLKAADSGQGFFDMTEEQIKHMAEQFLRWKLPENWHPDGGISFDPVANAGTLYEYKREPSGTNLFDYNQAVAMVRHMLKGMPQTKYRGSFFYRDGKAVLSEVYDEGGMAIELQGGRTVGQALRDMEAGKTSAGLDEGRPVPKHGSGPDNL